MSKKPLKKGKGKRKGGKGLGDDPPKRKQVKLTLEET